VLPPLSHAWQACESAVPLYDYIFIMIAIYVLMGNQSTRNLYYSLVAKDFTRVMCRYQPQLVLRGFPLRLSKISRAEQKFYSKKNDIILWSGGNLLASPFVCLLRRYKLSLFPLS
jgi:hypothetical protein